MSSVHTITLDRFTVGFKALCRIGPSSSLSLTGEVCSFNFSNRKQAGVDGNLALSRSSSGWSRGFAMGIGRQSDDCPDIWAGWRGREDREGPDRMQRAVGQRKHEPGSRRLPVESYRIYSIMSTGEVGKGRVQYTRHYGESFS